MGFAHHSRYIVWLEAARIELLRTSGQSYRDWEASGVLLPVIGLNIEYLKPAYYDDELQVCTKITELDRLRLSFEYIVFCPARGLQVARATSRHIFMNPQGRPMRLAPDRLSILSRLLANPPAATALEQTS